MGLDYTEILCLPLRGCSDRQDAELDDDYYEKRDRNGGVKCTEGAVLGAAVHSARSVPRQLLQRAARDLVDDAIARLIKAARKIVQLAALERLL